MAQTALLGAGTAKLAMRSAISGHWEATRIVWRMPLRLFVPDTGGIYPRAHGLSMGGDAERPCETLYKLGKRESETACSEKAVAASHVKEAIAAFHETLKEFSQTRDTVSLVSTTALVLGNVLSISMMWKPTQRIWKRPLPHTARRRKRSSREREPFNWAWIRKRTWRRAVQARRAGKRHGTSGGSRPGVSRRAEGIYARTHAADWASTEISLCRALLSIADRRQDQALAELSLEQLNAVRKACRGRGRCVTCRKLF